jgi:hypothetical protein
VSENLIYLAIASTVLSYYGQCLVGTDSGTRHMKYFLSYRKILYGRRKAMHGKIDIAAHGKMLSNCGRGGGGLADLVCLVPA